MYSGVAKRILIYWKNEDKAYTKFEGENVSFKYSDYNTLNIAVGKATHVIERSGIAEVILEEPYTEEEYGREKW